MNQEEKLVWLEQQGDYARFRQEYQDHYQEKLSVRQRKRDGKWCFVVPESRVQDDWFPEHCHPYVPEDVWQKKCCRTIDCYEFMEALELSMRKVEDCPPCTVIADVCRTTPAGSYVYFDVTGDDIGNSRLHCRCSSYAASAAGLSSDQRIRMTGKPAYISTRAAIEFHADKIHALHEPTSLSQTISGHKSELYSYLTEKPKREKFPIRSRIGAWEKPVAVLYEKQQEMEEFQDILAGSLELVPIHLAFTNGINLAIRIQDINLTGKADAICILHRPSIETYSYGSLYAAELCKAINESNLPVLTGLGCGKDTHPFCMDYADYNAPTLSMLAVKLAYWKASATAEKPNQGKLDEKQDVSIWTKLKDLLPW